MRFNQELLQGRADTEAQNQKTRKVQEVYWAANRKAKELEEKLAVAA